MADVRTAASTAALDAMYRAWACRQTVLRFTAALDARDTTTMKSHFADDAQWHRPTGTIHGHNGVDEFVAGLGTDMTMRHVVTNTRCDPLDDLRTGVESYFTVYMSGPDNPTGTTPAAVGRYLDRLERRGDDWIIVERTVVFDIQ